MWRHTLRHRYIRNTWTIKLTSNIYSARVAPDVRYYKNIDQSMARRLKKWYLSVLKLWYLPWKSIFPNALKTLRKWNLVTFRLSLKYWFSAEEITFLKSPGYFIITINHATNKRQQTCKEQRLLKIIDKIVVVVFISEW